MPNTPAINRFNKLIDDISRLYVKARNAQVQFGWETGRRIVQEEQDGAMRAEYGSELIRKVSEAMSKKYGGGFSSTNLRKMRRSSDLNPIQPLTAELDFTHYVELLPIKDEKIRERLEKRVLKENLTAVEIRQLVQKVRHFPEKKSSSAKIPPLKPPTELKLNTFAKSTLSYKLQDGYVLLDCGFVVSWPVRKEDLKDVFVTEKPSYTYEATIDRVVDGDTLLVVIEVGFGIKVHDKLRLRGIDTPHMGTPEGEKAKKFVQELLPVGTTIIIKSHKSRVDSHGRFVVDVLYKEGIENPQEILKDAVYLNQYLLNEGFAVRMAE